MQEYYRKRAPEFEQVYSRLNLEYQNENNLTAKLLREYLKDRIVLEIACGTGYWTQFLSETAEKIIATDILEEMLTLAKKKYYYCPIEFRIVDAYFLPFESKTFTGALANYWFSHIPKAKIDSFIEGLHRVLQPGSRVFMCDNNHIPGKGGPIISKEDDCDTVKLRTLSDGSKHKVIKNCYSAEELCEIFEKHVPNFSKKNIKISGFFWRVFYEV